MILLCYDGSPDANSAIDHAAELLHDEPVTILTVWEPFIDVMARSGGAFGMGSMTLDVAEIDEANEQSAHTQAQEGVERAKALGLNAQPRARAQITTVADAILAEAEELDAKAIMLGTRGLTGVKSLLLGSVSHAVLQHTLRPVIVVPSAEVARARAAGRH